MAQTIKLKRGLESARGLITPALGEIIYTTDNKEIFFGDGATAGGLETGYLNKRTGGTVANLTITGDLTVNGTTTSVNSTEVNIGDNIIILNSQETGVPSLNAGFEIERGTSANVSILWNETSDFWQLTDTAGTRRILDTDDLGTGYAAGTGIDITTGTISNTDLGSSQNIFKTFTADSGSTTASINADTLTVTGGTAVTTAIVGDVLTINSSDTTYTAGIGLALSGVDFSLDFSELTDKTTAIAGTTEFIIQDGGVESRKAASEIDLGFFNNNIGWTTNTGTVTSIIAGVGLSGGTITTTGTIALDFSELTDMTADISGTTEFILQNGVTESRKAASEIKLSAFNNDLTLTTTFAELTDTPATLGTAVANDPAITKLVAVNAAGTALVFVDIVDGGTF